MDWSISAVGVQGGRAPTSGLAGLKAAAEIVTMNRIPVRPPGRERSGAGWVGEAPERGAATDHERAPAADRVRGFERGRPGQSFGRVPAGGGRGRPGRRPLVGDRARGVGDAGAIAGRADARGVGPGPGPGRPATRRPTAKARAHRYRPWVASDDRTFRPTVLVRRGRSQGSGTIIASDDAETLILTAAHVVREAGPISIELHRYNLGLDRDAPGTWPQSVVAELAAIDTAADLAVLRIAALPPLPYVARLAPSRRVPAIDSIVTSIGIDLGTRPSGWSSRLVEALWFELNDSRDERLFFITARPPEHGRSGGGLFLPDGALIGVCVGHAELVRGRRLGVFASRESIHQLLLDHDLDRVIARSELRRSHLARPAADRYADPPAPSAVTPARAAGAALIPVGRTGE